MPNEARAPGARPPRWRRPFDARSPGCGRPPSRPPARARVSSARAEVGDHAPVAQDHDALRDAEHLVQPVGDVEHRDARRGQPARGRASSWSTSGPLMGAVGSSTMNSRAPGVIERAIWTSVLWSTGRRSTGGADVDLDAQVREPLTRQLAHGAVVHDAQRPAWQPAHGDVLGDAQAGRQGQLLGRDPDARGVGIRDAAQVTLHAVDQDPSAVRADQAGDGARQCGLPRAILAAQRDDLARGDGEETSLSASTAP